MAVKLLSQLKSLWITGYKPSQSDYSDLFDSTLLQTVQSTGGAVEFIQDTIYGTVASPEAGNITASYSSANKGTTILIIHQNGTEPTYPAAFKRLDSSADYDPLVVNFISCTYLDNNNVLYTISKLA
jgi:hypothetical protein